MKNYCKYIGLLISVHLTMQLSAQPVNLGKLNSSILFAGDAVMAYHDPLPFYDKGIFYLYFTLTEIENDSRIYMYTAMSDSKNLQTWYTPELLLVKGDTVSEKNMGRVIDPFLLADKQVAWNGVIT